MDNREGRYSDLTRVHCADCGWEGTVADCVHTYQEVGDGDVEPIDKCPRCNGENLMEFEGSLAPV